MNFPTLGVSQFSDIVKKRLPILDVRAPVEFDAGSIPGSFNLPILSNQERQEIGLTYKEKGQQAALDQGYRIVSGSIKESRVQAWIELLRAHPEMVITCFRGGKRSQITQAWLQDAGLERPRIDGGYKAFRNFFLSELDRLSSQKMRVISGATGSGKTLLLRQAMKFRPAVDLEAYAHHRGSAFGGYPGGQPCQSDFENRLASELICLQQPASLLVEDESRLVGRCAQPEKFFNTLRNSEIILLEESLQSRVQVTFDDYILNSELSSQDPEKGLLVFSRYRKSLEAISRKLGGLKYAEISKDLTEAESRFLSHGDLEPNRIWIEKLLEAYYDPMYFGSIQKRNPKILFRGSRAEALQWLQTDSL